MSYNLLTDETVLEDVEVRLWHVEHYSLIHSFGTVTVGELLAELPKFPGTEDTIQSQFKKNSSCDITLDYKVNGEDMYVPLANNTSDVSDEWYCISLSSKLLADSIKYNHSFVNETLKGLLDSKMNLSLAEYYEQCRQDT